jgi:tetratricopeptide (TPR) repeat protein
MALNIDFKKDFITFLECGFIAVSQLDENSAKALFVACKHLDPQNPLVLLSEGYILFAQMQLDQAAKKFEELLHKDPHNELAKSLLGLTLSLSPKTMQKGEEVLKDLEAHSKDADVKKLSHDTQAFVDVHLKKHTPRSMK